jgi:hypothetical protein
MNAATFLILSLLFLASIFCQPNQKSATIIEDALPATETTVQ